VLDRRLAVRAGMALALVNVRYWCTVAPQARRQLHCWRQCAETIDDPVLRTTALLKLDDEGFNAEAAALLATLAPRRHRRRAVEAIIATEIIYDYLDGLTESPSSHPSEDSACLFTAFTDALAPSLPSSGSYYRLHPHSEDRYLDALVATAREALAGLPAVSVLANLLQTSAARGVAAQLHIHAAEQSQSPELLERWAREQATGSSLQWREFLAGAACSVLSLHALIAAASDPRTTYDQALELDGIYLSISVLPTTLDSLIDYDADTASGRAGYVQHYESNSVLARRLAIVVGDVIARSRNARHGAHHVMTLVGVLAYYLSAPGASTAFARPVTVQLARQSQPLLAPTLVMMRTWRAAKHLRARWRTMSATALRRAT
jgi:tetraprenyl-beta-curcumene synthase